MMMDWVVVSFALAVVATVAHGDTMVSGTVFCDQCKDGEISVLDYPLGGVRVLLACPGEHGQFTIIREVTANWLGTFTTTFEGIFDMGNCRAQISTNGQGCGATAGPAQDFSLMFKMFNNQMYTVEPLIAQPAAPSPFCRRQSASPEPPFLPQSPPLDIPPLLSPPPPPPLLPPPPDNPPPASPSTLPVPSSPELPPVSTSPPPSVSSLPELPPVSTSPWVTTLPPPSPSPSVSSLPELPPVSTSLPVAASPPLFSSTELPPMSPSPSVSRSPPLYSSTELPPPIPPVSQSTPAYSSTELPPPLPPVSPSPPLYSSTELPPPLPPVSPSPPLYSSTELPPPLPPVSPSPPLYSSTELPPLSALPPVSSSPPLPSSPELPPVTPSPPMTLSPELPLLSPLPPESSLPPVSPAPEYSPLPELPLLPPLPQMPPSPFFEASACSYQMWMLPQHKCYWDVLNPDLKVSVVFGPLASTRYGPNVTLLQSMYGRGDPYRTLLREGTTALLNSYSSNQFAYQPLDIVLRLNWALMLESTEQVLLTAYRFIKANSGQTGNTTCKFSICLS